MFELKFSLNFNVFGILPRTIKGLRGIVFSPFIHANVTHLFNNSVPLFVLGSILFMFYNKVSFKVLVYGTLLTGLLTWFIGRESYHIGASGVVYLLFSFIFFSGVLKKHFRLIAVSLVTIFLYGGMVWYVLPIAKGISWEGHLSGFIVGTVFAYFYKNVGIVKEEYTFSKTDFDVMFDSHGNYIPPQEEETQLNDINYTYIYKSEEE
ncbi:rhomboid family intramembrane serine protease [Tenacibaculum sp. SG-28]|uniref:rhomboid family intramembrane serine protease n=1 Tax=Tenacibaculum sp. SG-28 TaxID=754426 RepID=UPI001E44B956|nr:rhomboid family intramembrane serine protease [Tenacibaculum sp. SG-28]